ncbi:neutral zinc metallopeptidase [Ilumatobacter sp.]|uniref:KPN_02809 family neutral zinc metallopeptidase n=1 Tax=Ilumatobacter sp. TaxID=1967498 RepID=UPI003AF9397C
MTKIRSRSSSRIQDRRGQGGGGGGLSGGLGDLLNGGLSGGRGRGGGGGMPGGLPGGMGGLLKGGGGLVMILVLGAVFILPKLLGGGGVGGALGGQPVAPAGQGGSAETAGGAAACDSELEQVLCGATDDVSEYWIEQLPLSFDVDYVDTQTVFFSGFTNTGCGQASSQTGPFYCPLDSLVYFDLDFLVKLQQQFGATGDLAAQYIVAHEFGHHVQNVLGINEQVRRAQQEDPQRANQYSVALELQADCFAGAWARDASDRDLFDTPGEVEEALGAAAAVGDDAIQEKTSGRVNPESWTHGSSAQRVQWFRRGFETGDPQSCTTFSEVL